MRVLVVGAGAVGGYFGARLMGSDAEIQFVARGEHGRELAQQGLRIHGAGRDQATGPLQVVSLEEAAGFAADLVLVAVKHGSLVEVSAKLPATLAPEGVVLPLLNGLDSEAIVAAHVGKSRVIAGVAYMSGALVEPGLVHLEGQPRAALAPAGGAPDPRVERLACRFEDAGIPTARHAKAAPMLWQKMLWNVPFNALCALIRKPVNHVIDDPALLELARQSMRECIAVAAVEGVVIADAMVEAMVTGTRKEFPHTVPSMLQDVLAGRPTEVDALQGAVVQRGDAHGVPVPVTRMLASLLGGLSGTAITQL